MGSSLSYLIPQWVAEVREALAEGGWEDLAAAHVIPWPQLLGCGRLPARPVGWGERTPVEMRVKLHFAYVVGSGRRRGTTKSLPGRML